MIRVDDNYLVCLDLSLLFIISTHVLQMKLTNILNTHACIRVCILSTGCAARCNKKPRLKASCKNPSTNRLSVVYHACAMINLPTCHDQPRACPTCPVTRGRNALAGWRRPSFHRNHGACWRRKPGRSCGPNGGTDVSVVYTFGGECRCVSASSELTPVWKLRGRARLNVCMLRAIMRDKYLSWDPYAVCDDDRRRQWRSMPRSCKGNLPRT